jgi:hypothetical protein
MYTCSLSLQLSLYILYFSSKSDEAPSRRNTLFLPMRQLSGSYMCVSIYICICIYIHMCICIISMSCRNTLLLRVRQLSGSCISLISLSLSLSLSVRDVCVYVCIIYRHVCVHARAQVYKAYVGTLVLADTPVVNAMYVYTTYINTHIYVHMNTQLP